MNAPRYLTLLLVVAAGLVGCDSGDRLYPATGTVNYKGAPVDGATVTFVPDGKGPMGAAVTDGSGKFTISTDGKPGMLKGTYKVTVTKIGKAAGMPENPKPEDMLKMAAKGAVVGKAELPAKYATKDSSGLTATVTEDGAKNNFPLDLQ